MIGKRYSGHSSNDCSFCEFYTNLINCHGTIQSDSPDLGNLPKSWLRSDRVFFSITEETNVNDKQ